MSLSKSHNTIEKDMNYQKEILQGVSRTFALTIPQLPKPLFHLLGNCYLLCRITDTIEDDAKMPPSQKEQFFKHFVQVVEGQKPPEPFAQELSEAMSSSATPSEHNLVLNTKRVVRITHSFTSNQRKILERCVRIMSEGMAQFQYNASPEGLENLHQMNRYCYYVAGVVGETMTDLFCDYSEEINKNRKTLLSLAVPYGQGLQMTNILKDMWDDQHRKACWLPKDIFSTAGFDLNFLTSQKRDSHFTKALFELLAISRTYLEKALQYAITLPRHETGIRLFILWAPAMAFLTLRRIHKKPTFQSGQEVKISRREVKTVIFVTKVLIRSNTALKILFKVLTRNLPSPTNKSNYKIA